MSRNSGALPELLAPAGSEESLRAALAAGADAVYFGSTLFSNRMRAKNFAGEALGDALRLTHAAGAKAHVTLNTRVRDREMDDALRLAAQVLDAPEEARADALIVADLGLAAEIRKRWPRAVLHASTQTSMGSPADCAVLARLGFSRLVLPRELSREEIAALADGPLEIEIFLHGALCVSCSGQCLLSWFCGGRSGNRGECAQPCRLPYRLDSRLDPAGKAPAKTPLSLADLCLAGRIPEVIGTGAASLKIEGRLKSAEYVWGVTSIYRRLLDERRAAEPGEIEALGALFTRGFTDGYFTRRYGKMTADPPGGRSENPSRDLSRDIGKALSARVREAEKAREAAQSTEIALRFTLRQGEPARLTLSSADRSVSVTVEGDVPSAAEGRPLDRETAGKSLSKFGGTGFVLADGPAESAEILLDEGLWMPVSRLNDLRRRAADALRARLDEARPGAPDTESKRDFVPYRAPERAERPTDDPPWTLEAADVSLLEEAFAGDAETLRRALRPFARLYVPAAQTGRARRTLDALAEGGVPETLPELCGSLPLFPLPDRRLDALFAGMKSAGCRRAECHTPGQIDRAVRWGFAADLSFRGNVTNGAAARVYRDLGCADTGLSPELPCGAVRSLGGSAVVWGKIPVTTLARCVLKEGNASCEGWGGRRPEGDKQTPCRGVLTDRVGARFPVIGGPDCTNIVYNAVPIWMGDRLDRLRGAESFRFLWTDETAGDVLDAAERYRKGERGDGRRIP